MSVSDHSYFVITFVPVCSTLVKVYALLAVCAGAGTGGVSAAIAGAAMKKDNARVKAAVCANFVMLGRYAQPTLLVCDDCVCSESDQF